MKKKQQAIATYNERAQKLDNAARTELLKGASEDWTGAKEAATEAGKFELKALNLLRSAGQKLHEAVNKDQLSFESFRRMKPALPTDMSYIAAQWCVKLAKECDKPFETLSDAGHARRLLFVKLESQDVPRRLEEQSSHDVNLWSELMVKASGFLAFFNQLTEDDPMQGWTADRLASFISTTQPICDKHAEAVQLAAAK
ncbi:MAG: hypothetical protein ABSD29_03985 [Verrucomicrobiota bacterium]|jgi:hypothetical protein